MPNAEKRYLIPEWERPRAIALVWPEHLLAGRGKLKSFYKDFIQQLSEHIFVYVLFSTVNNKFKPPKALQDLQRKQKIEIFSLPQIGDIWLRDYAPFPVRINDTVIPVKAKYEPSYLRTDAEKRYGKADEQVAKKFADRFFNINNVEYLSVSDHPVVLDGGNLIHNGQGEAIVTNRIITDNEHLFLDDIEAILDEKLGIRKLHIIPSEPGDDTGHADSLVRFLDPANVIVSCYPYPWQPNKGYIREDEYEHGKEVVDAIAEYFKNGKLKVSRMPNTIPKEGDNFENAEGNYLNFLRAGNLFFIPQYEGKEYEDANKRAVKALVDACVAERDIIEVPNCEKVAELGGVLNCITAHVY